MTANPPLDEWAHMKHPGGTTTAAVYGFRAFRVEGYYVQRLNGGP